MKVSVAMVTYNHEAFIAKALDSILMQMTDFDFEIVIGEDCSIDNTRSILIDYSNRHPDRFKLLLNENNLGMFKNGLQVLEACTGKYIAILEGDDYWTSADKLQKQADFLDAHPESVICFHNAIMHYIDKSHEDHTYCNSNQKEFSTAEDLLKYGNFIPSCSKMYRKEFFEVPDWISSLKMGDWPCDILLARYGNIAYINEVMGVYVIHNSGAWYPLRQNWEEGNKANLEAYNRLYDFLDYKYKKIIKRIIHDKHLLAAERYEDMDEINNAKLYAAKSITDHYVISIPSVIMIFRLYFPVIFKFVKSLRHACS